MSLDISLNEMSIHEIYSANITHNLGKMAEAAGVYLAMWRPEELGITRAGDLLPILEPGLADWIANPEKYKAYNPANKWGSYDGLVKVLKEYIGEIKEHPDSIVEVSR